MCLNLPHEIESLKDPKYILTPPRYVQLGMMFFMIMMPIFVLVWICYSIIMNKSVGYGEIIAAVFMIYVLLVTSNKQFRARWVAFACTKEGVYLPTRSTHFIHIPWPKVGRITTGWVQSADTKLSKGIIIELMLTNEEYNELVNSIQISKEDINTFVEVGISNNMHKPEHVLEMINSIRSVS